MVKGEGLSLIEYDRKQLCDMYWDGGLSLQQIADRVGGSAQSVYTAMGRIAFSKRAPKQVIVKAPVKEVRDKLRRCTECQELLSIDEFSLVEKTRHGRCWDCRKAIESGERTVLGSRTRQWVSGVKAKNGCLLCGEDEPCALVFHHLESSNKTRSIASMMTSSQERLAEEMRKCIVLCRNCHAKVHASILQLPEKTEPPAIDFSHGS